MTLYKLDEWEHNGRDDSDWYAVVYDDEKDDVYRVETGTTRAANALNIGPKMQEPTEEVLKKAEIAYARKLVPVVKTQEESRILFPDPTKLPKGLELRTTRRIRFQKREYVHSECKKCGGTGKWVNPFSQKDVRNCFNCNGTGQYAKSVGVTDKNGKKVWVYIQPGTVVKVRDSKSYGTFYRNGYNKPNGWNTTVSFTLPDGSEGRAKLEALRLNEPLPTDEWAEEKAMKLAKTRNFYVLFRTAGGRL